MAKKVTGRSSCRFRPGRPIPRRRSAPRSVSTASTSWASARNSTPPPRATPAWSFPWSSRFTRTSRSLSSPSRRPRPILLKKAAGITAGSKTPNKEKVGKVTRKQVMEIVKMKNEGHERDLRRGRVPRHLRHRPQHGHRSRRITKQQRGRVRNRTRLHRTKTNAKQTIQKSARTGGRHESVSAQGRRRSVWPNSRKRSSTKPLISRSASAWIRSNPTRWCAAPFRCRTAAARPFACSSSPRAVRPPKPPRPPARSSSASKT